jgi:hypothetical protein
MQLSLPPERSDRRPAGSIELGATLRYTGTRHGTANRAFRDAVPGRPAAIEFTFKISKA